jgi:hypothetical protein
LLLLSVRSYFTIHRNLANATPEALTAVIVLRDVTPCSPVETYRYFKLTYFLRLQGGGKVKNLKIRTALLFFT